jgi:hypothetical protein
LQVRRRHPPFAILLRACALVASLITAGGEAGAQGTGSPDPLLMRPVLDGDPRDPPRFRAPKRGGQQGDVSRFTQVPSYSYRPAAGAGTSGFDSTNAAKRKAKGKAGQPAKPATDPGAQPADAAPKSDATATPGATTKTDPPPPTPKQLQPASAPLAPRIRLQNRPGAPPLGPDLVAATIATTPPSRRPPPEDKPFDPLGIQVGAFNFRPAFEYTRGWDSNAPRNTAPPAASSWYNVYAPELLVKTDWARHEFTANLRGSYTTYDTYHSIDRPSVDAKANARIDVTSLTRIELEGRYLLFTDAPGSPNIQVGLAKLPIAQTYGSTVGIGQRFNRFEVVAKGLFDRTVYNDSEFVDGSTASNAGRNYNQYGAQLRNSYELTPGVKPFIELGANIRAYDLEIDAGGNNRSSQGGYGKAGSTFEPARNLTGEVSVGYLTRRYRDPTLADVSGWTVDAALIWLWTALTTVKLNASTTVAESTVPGVSGTFTRDMTIQVDHAFRRWLIGTLKFSRGFDDYVGSPREDYRYVASGAIAYSLTRELQLKGEYRQEWRYSNEPGNDFWAHVWLLGLRLQR